jgi:hypothetical protein
MNKGETYKNLDEDYGSRMANITNLTVEHKSHKTQNFNASMTDVETPALNPRADEQGPSESQSGGTRPNRKHRHLKKVENFSQSIDLSPKP